MITSRLSTAVDLLLAGVAAALAAYLGADLLTHIEGGDHACRVLPGALPPFLIALGLAFIDGVRHDHALRFGGDLLDLLHDVAQRVAAGDGFESAFHHAVKGRRHAAARTLAATLQGAHHQPLEDALREAARTDTRPFFRETGALVAGAIDAGGDVGSRLETLVEDFRAVRQAEQLYTKSMGTDLFLFRAFAVVGTPLLFGALASRTEFEEMGAACGFFAGVAALAAVVDGIVAAKLLRVLVRAPLYVLASHLVLIYMGGPP